MNLTEAEHEAVRQAGLLYMLITGAVIGTGPTRDDDVAELKILIHGIQRMVLAQAAAREYPLLYRLLGEVLPGREQDVTAGESAAGA